MLDTNLPVTEASVNSYIDKSVRLEFNNKHCSCGFRGKLKKMESEEGENQMYMVEDKERNNIGVFNLNSIESLGFKFTGAYNFIKIKS